jgi:ankyrin repeat protein
MKSLPIIGIMLVLVLSGCGKPAAETESLERAVLNNNGAKVFARAKGQDLNSRGKGGETVLHVAASKGLLESARALIQAGADPNAVDDSGATPLTSGIRNGVGIPMFRLLLESGSDPNKVPKGDWTPLHMAVGWGKADLVELVLAKGGKFDSEADGRPILTTAASSSTPEVIEVLIANGADPNEATSAGNTPLHIAAIQGTGVVDALLAGKARLNAKNRKGQTPLAFLEDGMGNVDHMGAQRKKMAAYLKSKGARR